MSTLLSLSIESIGKGSKSHASAFGKGSSSSQKQHASRSRFSAVDDVLQTCGLHLTGPQAVNAVEIDHPSKCCAVCLQVDDVLQTYGLHLTGAQAVHAVAVDPASKCCNVCL